MSEDWRRRAEAAEAVVGELVAVLEQYQRDLAASTDPRLFKRAETALARAAALPAGTADADLAAALHRAAVRIDERNSGTANADNCIPCGEGDDLLCPKSKRACGHHCNHSWTHDGCCWCGAEVEEEGTADAAGGEGEVERPTAPPGCGCRDTVSARAAELRQLADRDDALPPQLQLSGLASSRRFAASIVESIAAQLPAPQNGDADA